MADAELLEAEFVAFISQLGFPCLGAKAAINAGSYSVAAFDELASAKTSELLAARLEEFLHSELRQQSEYATFAAIFRAPTSITEERFEQLLWSQLSQLHKLDRKSWDPSVSSDPSDARFSFSFAGQALYVVGLNPDSCRLARRFAWPALIFNPHEQFERLRHDGGWRRMQESIRAREVALQGFVNPMLSDFGERSEARQYSGRVLSEDWHAPFPQEKLADNLPPPARCPFGH